MPFWLFLLFLAPQSTAFAAEAANGQWIWSKADASQYERASQRDAGLVPGIWVSTLKLRDGGVAQQLALWPGTLRPPGGVALVVRFDDGLHAIWRSGYMEQHVAVIESKLQWLLRASAEAEVIVREIQLDYDCPTSKLQDWAALVRHLKNGVLADVPLWITSLPVHMQSPSYGTWFQPSVAGHILQVFDVGTDLTASAAPLLAERAESQGLPFRVGLGAFERARRIVPGSHERITDHAGWFTALPRFKEQPHYSGAWVFAAGMPWTTVQDWIVRDPLRARVDSR